MCPPNQLLSTTDPLHAYVLLLRLQTRVWTRQDRPSAAWAAVWQWKSAERAELPVRFMINQKNSSMQWNFKTFGFLIMKA